MIRPPTLGWLLVVYGLVCTLLASGSAIYGLRVHARYQQVSAVLDSLASQQCVLVKPGSEVRVFPPRRDTLARVR